MSTDVNFTTYLFGNTNGRYIQYPQDYTQEIFEDILNKSNPSMGSFIAVHRKNNIMYYIYVRRRAITHVEELQNDYSPSVTNSYVGICIAFNSIMLKELSPLFKQFEDLIERLVIEEKVLSAYKNTIVIADEPIDIINNKLHAARDIINKAIREIEALYTELPPVSYGVESQEIQTFNILTDNENKIFENTHKYSFSIIYKDEISRSPLFIQAINNEIEYNKKQVEIKKYSNVLYALFFSFSVFFCILISSNNISPKNDIYRTECDEQKSRIRDYETAIENNNKEINSNKENIRLTERKILTQIKSNVEKINKISQHVPFLVLHVSGNVSNDTLKIDLVGNVLSEKKTKIPIGIKMWNSDGELLRGEKSPNGYTHIEDINVTEGNNYSITLTPDNTGVRYYGTTQIELTHNGTLLTNKDLDL